MIVYCDLIYDIDHLSKVYLYRSSKFRSCFDLNLFFVDLHYPACQYNITCSCCSVHVHPPAPTTHGTIVPWTCHIALRLWSSQVLLGRLLISTKAVWGILDSSIWVALALAVMLTSENDKNESLNILKYFRLRFSCIYFFGELDDPKWVECLKSLSLLSS